MDAPATRKAANWGLMPGLALRRAHRVVQVASTMVAAVPLLSSRRIARDPEATADHAA